MCTVAVAPPDAATPEDAEEETDEEEALVPLVDEGVVVVSPFRTPNGNPQLFNCRDENEP